MKGVLQTTLMSIGAGFLAHLIQKLFGTTYLLRFLDGNLVVILFALLAINGATLGVVLTKLRDLMDKNPELAKFSETKKEMQLSIREQVVLIPVAMLLLMANGSSLLTSLPTVTLAIEILIPACLAYALFVLYDTTMSVFILLDDSQS